MVQVELNNMYINIGANNGSEKLCTKQKTLRIPVVALPLRYCKNHSKHINTLCGQNSFVL
jgi:hypothetical protein